MLPEIKCMMMMMMMKYTVRCQTVVDGGPNTAEFEIVTGHGPEHYYIEDDLLRVSEYRTRDAGPECPCQCRR